MKPTRTLYMSGGRTFDLALPDDEIKGVTNMAGASQEASAFRWGPAAGIFVGLGIIGVSTWILLKKRA
jgi:hypothetical protein